MNQYEQLQKHQIVTQSSKYHHFLMNKTMQFLIPALFLLSLLLSYLFNFHLSTSPFPLFTHTLERKYVFLICNAILALLTKTSCFTTTTPSGLDYNGKSRKNNKDGVKLIPILSEMEAPEATMESKTLNVAHEEKGGEQENGSVDTKESGISILDSEAKEDGEENRLMLLAGSAKEKSEVNLNTEELNRKFEEFIRKMKEEIRIDAQRQLISV